METPGINSFFAAFEPFVSPNQNRHWLDSFAEKYHASFSLNEGRLMTLVLINFAESQQKLLWIGNHLIVDTISWNVLVRNLLQLYEGQPINRTNSYLDWVKMLESHNFSNQIAYWNRIHSRHKSILNRAEKQRLSDNVVSIDTGDQVVIESQLGSQATSKLQKSIHQAYNTRINEILLAALSCTFSPIFKTDGISVILESHGRESLEHEELNFSQSIGWFVSLFPAFLPYDCDLKKTIQLVKEEIRAIPQNGIGYSVLKYSNTGDNSLKSFPMPEILFSYSGLNSEAGGVGDGERKFNMEFGGTYLSTTNRINRNRLYPINIDCSMARDVLSVSVSYSPVSFTHIEIQRYVREFLNQIEVIISHCEHVVGTRYTPSDFPLCDHLTQTQLDEVVSQIQLSNGPHAVIEDIVNTSPLQAGLVFSSMRINAPDLYLIHYIEELTGNLNKV